jgi:hypothetical protein
MPVLGQVTQVFEVGDGLVVGVSPFLLNQVDDLLPCQGLHLLQISSWYHKSGSTAVNRGKGKRLLLML